MQPGKSFNRETIKQCSGRRFFFNIFMIQQSASDETNASPRSLLQIAEQEDRMAAAHFLACQLGDPEILLRILTQIAASLGVRCW